jgi:hypothetical protein
MKNIGEIKRSIELLIKYPHSFGYADFGDRGNACTKHLDRLTTDENIDYAESYAAVLVAMPKYSELHMQFAPVLAKELGITQWPRYDYMVKLLARMLGDDSQMKSSDTVEKMCLFTDRVQKYMKDTGKAELTINDLANI